MSKSFGFAILALLLALNIATAQPALTLSSGTGSAGGTVTLNLSLSSPSGSEPAAVQWTFGYPASSVATISVAAGAASTSAGKSVSCAGGSAAYICEVSGSNTNIISNGVVAVVTATLTSGATNASIGVTNAIGASPAGAVDTINSSGGSITLTPAAAVTVSSVSCTSGSLGSSGTSGCTVNLSGPAGSGGVTVTLGSSTTSLTVPASVTVPAGSSSAAFTATAGSITTAQTATITAKLNSSSANTSIALVTTVQISSLQCAASSLAQNASTTCIVNLSRATSSDGVTVTLVSSSTALTVPATVLVVSASSASFTASTKTISSGQTASITATLNGSSSSAAIILTAPAPISSISSLQCASPSLGSNASTTCTVTLSKAAPSGGQKITLADNAAALNVPASVTVASGVTSAKFTVTTGTISTAQSATISASIGGSAAVSVIISLTAPTVAPLSTVLALTGNASEVSGVTAGSIVHPSTTPFGLTGKVTAGDNGSVNFPSGGGVYFLNCCSNTNNAYYKFTSAALANIFGISKGQIAFALKSRYSFAQRQANAAAQRYTFDARDGNGTHQFSFSTQVVSPSLVFSYRIGGTSFSYTVPKGTEDQLFGNGVALNVVLSWDGSTANLYLNGTLANSRPYVPATANWNATSNFDLGAYENASLGGYNCSDDVTSQFVVSTSTSHGGNLTPSMMSLLRGRTAHPHPAGLFSDATLAAGTASLSCDANVVAGSRASCELRLSSTQTTDSTTVSLRSSSESVKVPATVSSRPGQSSIRFEVLTDADGPEETVSLEASAGADAVQASLPVLHPATPVLQAPREQSGTPGSQLRFDVIAADTLPHSLFASGLPAEATFDTSTGTFAWTPSERDMGIHRVTFQTMNSAGLSATKTVAVKIEAAPSDEAPKIVTVGEHDQALAVHAGTSTLATIPNAIYDGQPARAGDLFWIAATGIDCTQAPAARNFQVKLGSAIAAIQSIEPAGGAPALCRITLEVPSGVTGEAVPISIQMIGQGGRPLLSNTASIAVEN